MSNNRPKKTKFRSLQSANDPNIFAELIGRIEALRFRMETLLVIKREGGRFMQVTVKAHVVKRHKRKAHTRIVFLPND